MNNAKTEKHPHGEINHKEPLVRIAKRDASSIWRKIFVRFFAIIAALLIDALFIVLVTGLNPLEVYREIYVAQICMGNARYGVSPLYRSRSRSRVQDAFLEYRSGGTGSYGRFCYRYVHDVSRELHAYSSSLCGNGGNEYSRRRGVELYPRILQS